MDDLWQTALETWVRNCRYLLLPTASRVCHLMLPWLHPW